MTVPVVRISALGVAALVVAAAAIVAASVSPLVPTASAYVLSNGCDEYDPATGTYYRCTPDRTTFYTPDGVNPNAVYPGTEYSATYSSTLSTTKTSDPIGIQPLVNISDPIMIPPPAPYSSSKSYCSIPWWAPSPYSSIWNYSCYQHDVCYGSQAGRKYCDVRFWHNMIADCKRAFWVISPSRYACFANAASWYAAVRAFGGSHYKPRTSSFQP